MIALDSGVYVSVVLTCQRCSAEEDATSTDRSLSVQQMIEEAGWGWSFFDMFRLLCPECLEAEL